MAVVDQSTVYLVMLSIIGISLLLISIFCKDDKTKKGRREAPARQGAAVQRENLPPGARRRRGNRMARGAQQNDSDDEDERMDMMDEDDPMAEILEQQGKIGAKKLRKLQEKEERRQQRLMEEEERKEKKEREAMLEKKRKKEEEERKKEEAEKEEQERILREEQEKREHEEYLKLKEAFTIDEEGETDMGPDLNSQSLLQEFIDYIKEMKVIMLEDLAAHFKLKTQDAVQRVQELQAEGQLTGVMDDRGKFIYITMEELESVAKYIRQHGRVSIADLAESSNRLINLNPDNAATQKKLLSETSG